MSIRPSNFQQTDLGLQLGIFAIHHMCSPDRHWLIEQKKIDLSIPLLMGEEKKEASFTLLTRITNKFNELEDKLRSTSHLASQVFESKQQEICNRSQAIIDAFKPFIRTYVHASLL